MKKDRIKQELKHLNYHESRDFVISEIQKLKKSRTLKAFCKENNLGYNSVLTFSAKEDYHAPILIRDLLSALGYTVEMNKEITYKFYKDNMDNK